MCGFLGAVWTQETKLPTRDNFERATHQLAHRGPDDAGFYYPDRQLFPVCWLGHRRLSIIDLESGRQPLSNETESLQLVCNGEIYNYRELTRQLKSLGHRFKTESDSEVILHLYEEYGEQCVHHLNGMFAFVLWDEPKQKLFFARDRLGQKPLFYRQSEERLFLASELKAIRALDERPADFDPVALDLFLRYQYVPHTHCMIQGSAQLPPAHWGSFHNGKLNIQRYWSPPYDSLTEDSPRKKQQVQAELRGLLEDSVRLRLQSDVPVGTFLSGGVDSTLITGLVAHQQSESVRTFSLGFNESRYDETKYAQLAAWCHDADPVSEVVRPDLIDLLPKLVWHYDQPYADSSAIPTYYLSRLTRKEVTVALTGDGGDELFVGYDRYRAVGLAAKLERLPDGVKRFLSSSFWQKMPSSTRYRSLGRRLKRFLSEMNSSSWERYFRWISIFRDEQLRGLYSKSFQQRLAEASYEPISFLLDQRLPSANRDLVTQVTAADLQTYLPGDILTKVDIASMSHGLECRSPFLDHRVVELSCRMPISWKRSGKLGKKILTETFSDLLPEEIVQRPKMGFGVPLDEWFRRELQHFVPEILFAEKAQDRGIFEAAAVEKLWHEHQSGHFDHSARIWALLCLEIWFRTWMDQTGPVVQEVSL